MDIFKVGLLKQILRSLTLEDTVLDFTFFLLTVNVKSPNRIIASRRYIGNCISIQRTEYLLGNHIS